MLRLSKVAAGAFVAAALAFAQAPPAVAPAGPAAAVQVAPLQEIDIPPRAGILGQSAISLPEVIERVLANDPDLRVARIANEQAGYNFRAALGAYDPVAGFRAYHAKQVTPAASVLSGAANGKLTQTEWNGTPQISGLTPATGGAYSLSFANARQGTDNQFASLSPMYPTSLNLGLTQPLWRGLRFDENRYRIQVARKNLTLSGEQIRQRVIEAVTQAVQAYWELDFAWHNFEVQKEAVRLAERQYGSNRRLAEQGILAPIDVVAAQTQVATFQQSVFTAQQVLTQAENNLKMIMLRNRQDLLWGVALTPETRLDPPGPTPGYDEALRLALAGRPELAQSNLALDINRLDTRLHTEDTRVRVDAFANVSMTGLSGHPLPSNSDQLFSGLAGLITRLNDLSALNGLPPINVGSFGGTLPAMYVGSYGQSLSNLGSGQFLTVQAGVQISLPIRNRTAEARAAASAADGRRLQALRDQVEMAVQADVRNAIQAVASAQARLNAASIARQSAEEQYASEQRQFQAGTSTVFLVFQRQTDLIAARSRELRARTDFGQMLANLDRATAQTLEKRNINLAAGHP